MATLRQIASIIENSINGGRGITNERIPFLQIVDEVVFTYSRIYDEYAAKGVFTPYEKEQFYVKVDCVPVKCLPMWECCDGVSSKDKVLAADIPRVKDIRYVGLMGYNQSMPVVRGAAGRYYGHSRFQKGAYAWLINNTRVVIVNPPTFDLSYISIEAFFEDPRQVKFDCCHIGLDDEFPIPNKFVDLITGKLIDSYMRYTLRVPVNQPNTQTDQI